MTGNDQPTYELAHALWCEMPTAIQDVTEVPAIREWLRRAMAATSTNTGALAAVNTDDACGDEWQPAHAAGSHPQDCRTCSEQQQPRPLLTARPMTDAEYKVVAAQVESYLVPDVTRYVTKHLTDMGVLPVPEMGDAFKPPAAVTWPDVKAAMDKIRGADNYSSPTPAPFEVQIKGMLIDGVADRLVHGDRSVPDGPRGLLTDTTAPCLDDAADAEHLAALADAGFGPPPLVHTDFGTRTGLARTGGDQCPTCTSPYRHHRFVLPDPNDPADQVIICADGWHGGPLPDAVEGDTTERTWP